MSSALLATDEVVLIPAAITSEYLATGTGCALANSAANYPPNKGPTSPSITPPSSGSGSGSGGTTWYYAITGVDSSGKETMPGYCTVTTGPTTGAGFAAGPVTLAWTPSARSASAAYSVVSHNVYRGSVAGVLNLIANTASALGAFTDNVVAAMVPATFPPGNYLSINPTGGICFDLGSGVTAWPNGVDIQGFCDSPSDGLGWKGAYEFGAVLTGGTSNSSPATGAVVVATTGYDEPILWDRYRSIKAFDNNYAFTSTGVPHQLFRYFWLGAPENNYLVFGNFRLRFIWGNIGGSASSTPQPVEPVITPFGAKVPFGSQGVTITSTTGSAAILYTTDGSQPSYTNTSGTLALTGTTELYSAGNQVFSGSPAVTGAFTLTVASGSTVVINAIAVHASASVTSSTVSTATFTGWSFANAENQYDNFGNVINVHAATFCWETGGSRIHMFGQPALSQQTTTGQEQAGYDGVHHWSSINAGQSWTSHGKQFDDAMANGLQRFKVLPIRNIAGEYVGWGHFFGGSTASANRAIVKAAPSLDGPWRTVAVHGDGSTYGTPYPDYAASVAGSFGPLAGFKDHNAAADLWGTSGKAYLAYSYATTYTGANAGIVVSQLTPDFYTTTGAPVIVASGNLEGVAFTQLPNLQWALTYGAGTYYNSTTISIKPQSQVCTGSPLIFGNWAAQHYLYNDPNYATDGSGWTGQNDPLGSTYNGQASDYVWFNLSLALFEDYWAGGLTGSPPPSDLIGSRLTVVQVNYSAGSVTAIAPGNSPWTLATTGGGPNSIAYNNATGGAVGIPNATTLPAYNNATGGLVSIPVPAIG